MGLNKGQVLFGIVAISSFCIVMYFEASRPYQETASPLSVLAVVALLPLAIIGFFILLLNIATNEGVSFSYRPLEPSLRPVHIKKELDHISRVVVDINTDDEQIIYGDPSWSYRNALLKDWPFKNIPKSGEWIVKDERGNDISNIPLGKYDSLAIIEYRIPEELIMSKGREKEEDNSDEYTSIDQGVIYYD